MDTKDLKNLTENYAYSSRSTLYSCTAVPVDLPDYCCRSTAVVYCAAAAARGHDIYMRLLTCMYLGTSTTRSTTAVPLATAIL